MTRGKWVALAVGLAVLAVLVPYGPAVWRAVAYAPERLEPVVVLANDHPKYAHTEYTHTGPIEFISGMYSNGMRTTVSVLTVKRKRHTWIPGEEFIVPDQVCPWCRRTTLIPHEYCFTGRGNRANIGLRDGTRLDLPETFRCTCPHASHAQESE